MLKTVYSSGGMVTAPHHLAALAGRDVLAEGGNAIEAMVAAAATIAVVYPHMNGIGGDGFWLIRRPGEKPVAIDAAGVAAQKATTAFYQGRGQIPERGPLAALTVAGTVSGWQRALELSQQLQSHQPQGGMPLSRLLQPAIDHARNGVSVTRSQAALTAEKLPQLQSCVGFSETYTVDGKAPPVGYRLRQPELANSLQQLAQKGLDDFYRGELAETLGAQLEKLGSPLTTADLNAYQAAIVEPLSVRVQGAQLLNLPPPTQGLTSLMILGIADRYGLQTDDELSYVHGLVEASKRAFRVRDRVVTDPGRVPESLNHWLSDSTLSQLATEIDPQTAMPWPDPAQPGDTVWLGCIDKEGVAVSFIQSVYWEFGSGVVLPGTGICWQNRGLSFSLDAGHLQALEPGRKPFHTLNPAMALFDDGRLMTYGTMGGEGQPQTQAAVFSRYAWGGMGLQEAVTAPRWLLGRTWGDTSTTLKLERRIASEVQTSLLLMGHQVERLEEDFSDTMGHAGAVVMRPDGVFEGASDPRSDGLAVGL